MAFRVLSDEAPVVEIDEQSSCAYVRFQRKAKVARTVEHSPSCNVDLDARGDVVGVELLNIRDFSIRMITNRIPVKAPNVEWDRARFMPVRKPANYEYA